MQQNKSEVTNADTNVTDDDYRNCIYEQTVLNIKLINDKLFSCRDPENIFPLVLSKVLFVS